MRLLNTTTLKIQEFFGTRMPSQIPYYAILSHRWGDEEVTFQDMQSGKGPEMGGWSKITGCCAQANEEGWEYVWIDSCCIDKSSSTELSEAINSMFRWYQRAQVCYAYLEDVPADGSSLWDDNSTFRKSKWFTRGWTLQELLAPQLLVFYDHDWNEIGTKSELEPLLELATGIKAQYLRDFSPACVAQKMSWMSNRETLREEDMAYCLLGIFGVNLPLLYGEGSNAFIRLQLEIIKESDDESIFAWGLPPAWRINPLDDSAEFPLLAQSPANFEGSDNIRICGEPENSSGTRESSYPYPFPRPEPYSMTNRGLQANLTLIPYDIISKDTDSLMKEADLLKDMPLEDRLEFKLFAAPLNCGLLNGSKCICLKLFGNETEGRFSCLEVFKWDFQQSPYPAGKAIQRTLFILHSKSTSPFSTPKIGPKCVKLICEEVIQKGFKLSPHRTQHEIKSCKFTKTAFVLNVEEEVAIDLGGVVKLHARFKSTTDSFDLLIWTDWSRCCIELLHPSRIGSIHKLIKTWGEESNLGRDRQQCMLTSGEVLLVSIKKVVENNQGVYVVHFRIEPPSQRVLERAKASYQKRQEI